MVTEMGLLSISLQLIRIRSKDGNFRFEVNPTDDGKVLAKKVSLDPALVTPSQVTVSLSADSRVK